MKLDYLRVSLTDRCNLNCIYCRPRKWVKLLEKDKLLSFEEIVKFTQFVTDLGVKKIRLTGGEPLLRKDVDRLVSMIARIKKIEEITLTTNGTRLEELVLVLKNAGLSRVNVSLDSLNRKKFFQITGYDGLPKVVRGIKAAREAGLDPVKINVVGLKGINDSEILDFVKFALKNSLILRFIEYMPVHGVGKKHWYISNQLVKKIIKERWGKLEPASFHGSGPAEYFRVKKTSLILGFISPVSRPFCHKCSRLRLSIDGKLKPCLVSGYEMDVKKALREKDNHLQVKKLISSAVRYKEEREKSCPNFNTPRRFMFQIGG